MTIFLKYDAKDILFSHTNHLNLMCFQMVLLEVRELFIGGGLLFSFLCAFQAEQIHKHRFLRRFFVYGNLEVGKQH